MNSKIDARLQRIVREAAEDGRRMIAESASTAANRIVVVVTYEGDLAALRAAGLESGYDTGSMVTGLIAPGDVARLAALANVIEVAAPPELRPKLDNTVAEMRVPWKVPPTTPWPGKGTNVIVAVIDTGIDIFHDSFRKSDGTTRILELWDQSVTSPAHPPPPGLTQVGAVFNAGHINAGLTAGAPFLSRDTIGHGTHVAGIAAGNGRQDDRCTFPGAFVGVAPEADLVIVRGGGAAADAFAWCAAAGARHPMADGRPRRVVINFSLGGDLGPHDGTGDLSLLLGPILRPAAGIPPGLAIVAAAGNEGNYEHHESGTIPPNGTVTVPFYVPENSMTADDLEIWYNGTATLNVQITAPADPASGGTNTTGVVTPGAPGSPFTIGAMTLTVTSSVGARAQNNSKKRIQVNFAFPATTSLRSGLWQLALTETAGVQADWGAWFQPQLTDKFPVFKLPTDPEHTERRRLNTISDPGSALDTIAVASYNDRDGKLSDSSSRGVVAPPGTPSGEVKPTVAAPGTGVKAPRSRADPTEPSSCCDQRHMDKSGTSMATPHVTGLVALMFEKNRDLTFEQVRGHLQHAARIDGIPAADVPPVIDPAAGIRHNPLWGAGKVNAAQTLADVPVVAAPPGGGGGGPGSITLDESQWGYSPHTFVSRLGDWRSRFGQGPGVMLVASLISEHVDEVLRLVNNNRKVGAVWRRHGGPRLVRHLLDGTAPDTPLPIRIEGCDVPLLLSRLLPVLDRFGGARIRSDIARYGGFAGSWPGAPPVELDIASLKLARP